MSFVGRSLRWFTVIAATLLLVPGLTFAQHYTQTNLVSDIPGMAPVIDANLSNPWGLTRSSGGPWWVGNNGSGTSTVYDGNGNLFPPPPDGPLVVVVPPPFQGNPPSAPTGVVFNRSNDFVLANGKPASFIFATEDGTISGWNGGNQAMLEVDNSPEAVYKGATTADVNGVRYLYVTNFRSGRVEVYDTKFHRVHFSNDRDDRRPFSENSFEDEQIPRGFAPFNVQNIGGSLFVTYAKQDRPRHDPVGGDGLGFVDIFSPSGKLLGRLEQGPWLNAPWGVVWAPRDFGEFSNRVLVGNFRSGWIAAFNGFTGKFLGLMKTFDDPVHRTGEKTVTIDGLWALTFGNSALAGPYNSMFFTAGIQNEQHGLFGTLTAVAAEQDGDEE